MVFADRTEAGQFLADKLQAEELPPYGVVLGLPRGGVVLAAEIAREWGLMLDIVVAKKIGHPQNPEAAIGAVAEDGTLRLEERYAHEVDSGWLQCEIDRLLVSCRAQRELLTGKLSWPSLDGRNAILVDDGIATGQTMFAAIDSCRRRGASHVHVAVPVGPPEAMSEVRRRADTTTCLFEPERLSAVGAYYSDFRQTTDEEVRRLLETAEQLGRRGLGE